MFKLSIISFVVFFTTFVNFNRINGYTLGNYEQELNRSGTLEQNDLQLEFNHTRSKRALHNLYYVLDCATECGPFSYNNYGCYCGWGGSGESTDGIDRCCEMHDKCYGDTSCPQILNKIWHYQWRCQVDEPICDIDEGTQDEDLSWGQEICKCDRDFALCLAQYPCQDRKRKCNDYDDHRFIPRMKYI